MLRALLPRALVLLVLALSAVFCDAVFLLGLFDACSSRSNDSVLLDVMVMVHNPMRLLSGFIMVLFMLVFMPLFQRLPLSLLTLLMLHWLPTAARSTSSSRRRCLGSISTTCSWLHSWDFDCCGGACTSCWCSCSTCFISSTSCSSTVAYCAASTLFGQLRLAMLCVVLGPCVVLGAGRAVRVGRVGVARALARSTWWWARILNALACSTR